MKYDFTDVPNDRLSFEIDRWIKSERDRNLLKRRLIDGRTFDELSEEFHFSKRHVIRITIRAEERLFNKICH
jgi:DNA-directed RNA polymerase specialized sigma subunit